MRGNKMIGVRFCMRLTLLAGISCLGMGCAAPVEGDSQDVKESIYDGQLEPGVPSVVLLTDQPVGANDTCGATMLTPTVAVTSKHCNDDHRGMILDSGSKSTGFVDHLVDTAIVHPVVDLMLVHTSSPMFTAPGTHVGDIAVDSYMDISSTLPAVGDNIITVGYGVHDPTPGDPGGTRYKRSGAETVVSVSSPPITEIGLREASSTYAGVPPGRTGGGDSGSPIVFNNKLVAVNYTGHTANDLIALELDVPWIQANINLDLPTATDSLYIMRNGTLLRTNPKFGNYVTAVDADFSSTTTSMAAFPTSGSDIYIVAYANLYDVTTAGVLTELPNSHQAWDGPTKLTTMNGNLYIMQGGCLRRIMLPSGRYSQPLGTCGWTGVTALTSLNDLLYAIQGGNLYSVSGANGFTQTLATGLGTVSNMVAVGSSLYIQRGDLISRATTSGSLTTVSSGWTNTDSMTGLDGSLYVTKADSLYRASVSSNTATVLGYHDWVASYPGAILMVSVPGSP